ncbi:MAG: hypothetical protein ACE37F_22840 [Nannocystaceae bacterium]|nr:hypothetical protein [bacterium]
MNEHDNVHHLHADLFSRDGHLTMLTIDRFESGELSTAGCETVIDHVESCEVCAHRLAAIRTDAVSLEPPAEVLARAASANESGRSWLGTLAIAGTVAAAAALLVMAVPQPQQVERNVDEEARLTASPYTTTAELEGAVTFDPAIDVSIVASESSEAVEHGDRVSWDTTLTLNVSPHEAGYVAVVSATEILGEELADTDGGGADHDVVVLMPVTQLQARSGPHALTLEHSARVSAETSNERLMAIFCEEPFELDDPFDPALPSLRPDCTSVEVTLTRFGEVADS